MTTLEALRKNGVEVDIETLRELDAGKVCVCNLDTTTFETPFASLVRSFEGSEQAERFIICKAESLDEPSLLRWFDLIS